VAQSKCNTERSKSLFLVNKTPNLGHCELFPQTFRSFAK